MSKIVERNGYSKWFYTEWFSEKVELHEELLPSGKRVKLPAFIYDTDGTKQWWLNGKLHREGGLPAVESPNGYRAWYVEGKRHRDGGLLPSGAREALPAVEYADGYKEWWVNGEKL